MRCLTELDFKSIKAITNTGLYKDMVANHYEQIGSKLRKFIESSDSVESQKKSLSNRINNLLKDYLQNEGIKWKEGYGEGYNITDTIPVQDFVERLWPMIENNSYSDDKSADRKRLSHYATDCY